MGAVAQKVGALNLTPLLYLTLSRK